MTVVPTAAFLAVGAVERQIRQAARDTLMVAEHQQQMRVVMKLKKMVQSAIALAVLAQVAQAAHPAASPAAPIPIAATELSWTDLDPEGAPGVKIATLWGDSQNGAFGAFLRLPAGFAAPLHTHTHDMKLIIVSGTYIQAPDGKPDFRLGPGSYLMQPGGDYRHTTSCAKASECLFFVESDGAFDLHPAASASAPSP